MTTTFKTDYASHPGETLAETLEVVGLTQTELARRMGRPIKTINEIVQGKAALTADTALELERVLGVPASFWSGLESNYREHLARQRAAERLEVDEVWLDRLPIAAMQKRGWISRPKAKRELMEEMLTFFGCTSVSTWAETWGKPEVAFRKSPKLRTHTEAVVAWLCKAEQIGREQTTAVYDAETFRGALKQLRAATTLPVSKWYETIRAECNAAGVAYVILPEFSGVPVSGAARQVSDTCALIVQTGRYKDDGHFWFTFFHEARHVLQGKLRREWLVEYEGKEDPLERDANQFAREWLVPSAELRKKRQEYNGMPVKAAEELANELGVAPGIVAGRLHHDDIWKHFVGQKLIRRYEISELVGYEVTN